MAVHRGVIPERPATPLATSTLLTRGSSEPALGHELAREIAIADRIDAIVAFVTMGGVRSIQDRVGLAEQTLPVPAWPLALHRHYSRREIAAAVGGSYCNVIHGRERRSDSPDRP